MKRPAIEIHHARSVDPEVLRQLAAGIEEEGAPHEMVVHDGGTDAGTLAARGARSSMLLVAIGIADDGSCAVAHDSFPPGRPVLVEPGPLTPEAARRVGQNAARIVTQIPLSL